MSSTSLGFGFTPCFDSICVGWDKAHPFGVKHDLAYLFSSKAETVNAVTYTNLLTKYYLNYITLRRKQRLQMHLSGSPARVANFVIWSKAHPGAPPVPQ